MKLISLIAISSLIIFSTALPEGRFLEWVSPNAILTDSEETLNQFIDAHVEKKSHEDLFEEVGASANNSCLNGGSSSAQEQLLSFTKGPCSPFIMMPGLLASKLTVAINCTQMQTYSPAVFAACGWNSCSGSPLTKTPKSEYQLWISDFFGPLSLATKKTSICVSLLLQLTYDPSAPTLPEQFVSPVGVKVSVSGADPATASEGECGFFASTNLAPEPIQALASLDFTKFKNAFVNLGYQVGLTLFSVPYDWRSTSMVNGCGSIMVQTIEQAYNITGKPVVLMSHSLGNFGVLTALNMMSFQQKQKMVANWISFFNPLTGVPEANVFMFAGVMWFGLNVDNFTLGVNAEAQRNFLSGTTSSYDLMTKDYYITYANEPWMQQWAQRQNYEDTYKVTDPDGLAFWQNLVKSGDVPVSWYPTPLNDCAVGFSDVPNQCGLRMFNWSAVPGFVINVNGTNQSYTASQADLAQLAQEYPFYTPNYQALNNITYSNNIFQLINPEVPTTILFGNFRNTAAGAYFPEPPSVYTSNDEIPKVHLWETSGDGIVPTCASLIPALKWVWENQNGVGNAQPVKVAEFCSVYNQKGDPFDVTNSSGQYQITTSGYIGVDCDCLNGTKLLPNTGALCSHGNALIDNKLTQFYLNSAHTNFVNNNYQNTGACMLTNAQLLEVINNCPVMSPGTQFYWNMINQARVGACGSSEENKTEEVVYI